jgi:hypothetical protein
VPAAFAVLLLFGLIVLPALGHHPAVVAALLDADLWCYW